MILRNKANFLAALSEQQCGFPRWPRDLPQIWGISWRLINHQAARIKRSAYRCFAKGYTHAYTRNGSGISQYEVLGKPEAQSMRNDPVEAAWSWVAAAVIIVIVIVGVDGDGRAVPLVCQPQLAAAWKLSQPKWKTTETQAETVGRADRRLDQGADSLPLQQRRYRLSRRGLHHSGSRPVHLHRGRDYPARGRQGHQNEKPDGRHPLGADLQGERFMRIAGGFVTHECDVETYEPSPFPRRIPLARSYIYRIRSDVKWRKEGEKNIVKAKKLSQLLGYFA